MNKAIIFTPFSEIEHLPFLNISILKAVFPSIKDASLYQKIKRWMDSGKIFALKKGLYMSHAYFQKHQFDINFHIFVANHLRQPSYVSGAYVLQRYDILTEMTDPITSVTLKSTYHYNNKQVGDFIYNSISESLYTGYHIEKYGNENVYIASKAKALFDFLYFKYWMIKSLPRDLKHRERLDLEVFNSGDRKEFGKYCRLSRIHLFRKFPNLLFDE